MAHHFIDRRYRHKPMLCRKCHGPMTARLECTKCNVQGRMMAVRPSHVSGYVPWREGEPIFIDLKGRTDEAAKLVRESTGRNDLLMRAWGGGSVSL